MFSISNASFLEKITNFGQAFTIGKVLTHYNLKTDEEVF